MIIAGTGHRPGKLGGYTQSVLDRVRDIAIAHLEQLPHDTVIISGMALGWDQALALAALHLKMKVIAYVPFEGQENGWPTSAKILYQQILKQCHQVVYCSSPGYSNFKMHKRNKMMVDNCDQILAFWNGDPSGGTGSCIKYAQVQGKEIINIYDKFIYENNQTSR